MPTAVHAYDIMHLQYASEQAQPTTIAILALKCGTHSLVLHFLADWHQTDIFHHGQIGEVSGELTALCEHVGVEELLHVLRSALSPSLRITAPETILTGSLNVELERIESHIRGSEAGLMTSNGHPRRAA
jgi:hypothetical protein